MMTTAATAGIVTAIADRAVTAGDATVIVTAIVGPQAHTTEHPGGPNQCSHATHGFAAVGFSFPCCSPARAPDCQPHQGRDNGHMSDLWWMLAGVAVGAVLVLPILRILLRRAERMARDAERRARDAERLAEIGSMTGGLAHEIKNPLSTIGLNAQLLKEEIVDTHLPAEVSERAARRLGTLMREVERLRGILTDFLQFAGRMNLDPQPHDVRVVVEELTDFFHPQCDQARLVLRSVIPPQPITANIDERLFKQALLNLMLNAVQAMTAHAPAATRGDSAHATLGELILRVEADADEVRVHVIDTGPGIDVARRDEIFRPYVSNKPGGTGLGLSTARRIIEEHGGRLTLASEPGKGSDFVIHLPLLSD
jgi:signal transduction histidine kinase